VLQTSVYEEEEEEEKGWGGVAATLRFNPEGGMGSLGVDHLIPRDLEIVTAPSSSCHTRT